MKVFIFSILLPLLISSNFPNEQTTGYIKIFCDGDTDKPYPVIIFNCLGKFDTTHQNMFVYTFDVSDTLLNNLDKLIRQTRVSDDYDLINPPIGVHIVLNGRDTFFRFGFKTAVSKLFKQIAEQFSGKERQNVKHPLDQLSRRLSIPIQN